MSQKGDPVAASPAPVAMKGVGRRMGAVLIALVCVGAFAGAGAGTYVTFRYVILPSIQGSNNGSNNNNNGGSCTSNCNNNGGGNTGCTSNCHSSNYQSTSNGVTLTITQYGFSSSSFNGTMTITQTRTMNSISISGNGQNCNLNAPSGQGLTVNSGQNNQFSITLGANSSNGQCSGSLTSFQSGTTYSFTIGDTNGDSFNFSITD